MTVGVDFKQPEGRRILQALAKESDVLIENFLPGALDRAGLGYEDLKAINPRLVYCS
jgi:crotonobetainyl-CoA:carnitine CoA-transferase CaiB-like acyl-CoA transferase